jgi:hypothetical protein
MEKINIFFVILLQGYRNSSEASSQRRDFFNKKIAHGSFSSYTLLLTSLVRIF